MEAAMLEQDHQRKLLSSYDRIMRTVRLRLLSHYPAKLIWSVIADSRRELVNVIPKIPSIGEQNIWQQNLDNSSMGLALYRSLKKQYFSFNEAARMIYMVFETYWVNYPKPLRWVYGWYYFSPWFQDRLRQSAANSQFRKYPQDWVFTYVKGDGIIFNAGVDISECAILKFYRAQRAEEFTPHWCKLDHAMGKILGLGFTRHGTLAEGAAVCDCRWKRGAETPGWIPAIEPVYKEEPWKPSLNNT
jgi:hypothetical protein